ncbi:hypothetical protein I2494_05300 [Budviciaceae bacterium BWR-B9]|uniref:Restriction alleviation protein, Lar family n=1 Tax=Limnobaculum allomyrinae TaxID=2791986 RepID=A0ABS1IN84_9GAMM|nr:MULTISPECIES: hypothetical protein [Limnobaculum]MBK5143134.1 hypothetical protein [Limnobaculum allomyrinae]MBV7691023.1 hypothetical protein [Limnobaculum sp. M2-1]
MKKLTYLEWIKYLPKHDSLYSSSHCPACGSKGLSYQYFGFKGDDVGWKIIWCNSCNCGVKISRTKIPAESNSIIGDKEQESFLNAHAYLKLIL